MVLGIRPRVSLECAWPMLCGTGIYHHPDLWMNFSWEERESASITIIEKQKDPDG